MKRALWAGGIQRANKPPEKMNTPGLQKWEDLVSALYCCVTILQTCLVHRDYIVLHDALQVDVMIVHPEVYMQFAMILTHNRCYTHCCLYGFEVATCLYWQCCSQTLMYAGQHMDNDKQLRQYHVPPVSQLPLCTSLSCNST